MLRRILTDYHGATAAALEDHPLAQLIRGEAEETVSAALGELGTGLSFRTSDPMPQLQARQELDGVDLSISYGLDRTVTTKSN